MAELYIYTERNHPKRGFRYGQSFKVVRKYRDIRDVIWSNGEKGYVRVGEFTRIDKWPRESEADAFRRHKEEKRRRALWKKAKTERKEKRMRILACWWAGERQEQMNRKLADSFRLQAQTQISR